MDGVPAVVLLQAAPAGGGDVLGSFLIPMALIFGIFYFLVIRPQQKRQKDHDNLLKSIERGDSVVTTGGLHGKVTGVTDDVLTLEVAQLKNGERVRLKTERARIEKVEKAGKAEKPAKGGESS